MRKDDRHYAFKFLNAAENAIFYNNDPDAITHISKIAALLGYDLVKRLTAREANELAMTRMGLTDPGEDIVGRG